MISLFTIYPDLSDLGATGDIFGTDTENDAYTDTGVDMDILQPDILKERNTIEDNLADSSLAAAVLLLIR